VLITKLANWRPEILAYWNHPGVTNAFTEAMNGQVKRIAHSGRGYSFPQLRKRFLEGYTPKARRVSSKTKVDLGWEHVRSCPQCRDRALAMWPDKKNAKIH
jgi:hypothetical protein